MFYYNFENNITQFFDLQCDVLLSFKVFNNILVTIENDDPEFDHEKLLQAAPDSNMWQMKPDYTFIRFTEIVVSEEESSVQFVQIGERMNVNAIGNQKLNKHSLTSNGDRIQQMDFYQFGDWFKIIVNGNSDRFSVLFT